jgi:putative chitinase
MEENLNYSAQGLNKIFPKYFARAGRDANAYAKKPEKIANVVYSSRMGNGDEASGDGYRYRGRGFIQLTGKSNYSAFAADMEMPLEEATAWLDTAEGAVWSACWFWDSRELNKWADKGDIVTVTKKINGGTIGLEDRKSHYAEALQIFT